MIIITRRRRRRRRMERSKLKRKSPRRARWPARSREIIRPNGSSELRDQRVGRDALSHHDARARDVEAGQHAIPRGDELRGDGDGDDEVLAETVERGSSGGEAAEVREGDEERDRAVKRVEEQTGDGAEDAGTGHAGGPVGPRTPNAFIIAPIPAPPKCSASILVHAAIVAGPNIPTRSSTAFTPLTLVRLVSVPRALPKTSRFITIVTGFGTKRTVARVVRGVKKKIQSRFGIDSIDREVPM